MGTWIKKNKFLSFLLAMLMISMVLTAVFPRHEQTRNIGPGQWLTIDTKGEFAKFTDGSSGDLTISNQDGQTLINGQPSVVPIWCAKAIMTGGRQQILIVDLALDQIRVTLNPDAQSLSQAATLCELGLLVEKLGAP